MSRDKRKRRLPRGRGQHPKNPIPKETGLRDLNTHLVIRANGEVMIPSFELADGTSPEFEVYGNPRIENGIVSVSDILVCIGDRIFSEEELPRVRTVIKFDLPYRLTKFDGTWAYLREGIEVSFTSSVRNVKLAAENLGLVPQGDIERFTLEPDDLGLCGFTTVNVISKAISRLPLLHERLSLLEGALKFVNPIIDWYCLTHKDFGKRRIAPVDIPIFYFGHGIEGESELRNLHTFYLPIHSEIIFRSPQTDFEDAQNESIKNRFALAAPYRLAYQYWIDAKRSLHASEARYAAVQAISCLEIAMFQFLRDCFTSGKPSQVTIVDGKPEKPVITTIDLRAITGPAKKSIGLQKAFEKILPEVMKAIGKEMPKNSVLQGCLDIQKERHKAVHDPSGFQAKIVEQKIDNVAEFVDFLIDARA